MAGRDGDDAYWIDVMRGPADKPTRGYQAHLDRIDELVRFWHDGRISIDEKRMAIANENRQFYGPSCPKRLLWPGF